MDRAYTSPNARIVRALKDILPVAHYRYSGDADNYAVFQVMNRRKSAFISGEHVLIEATVYLDIITDHDPTGENSILKKIDRALTDEGLHVLEINDGSHDLDLNLWHTEFVVLVEEERDE